ncbi:MULTISPECIES: hypothetical protein [Rhodonellum]|nr:MULTISPECIES: hypothetical protein [Rhodonellum]SDY49655.1 hypothetical protein SAMN05444412_101331 [Rhodonellum ikkaensis]
MYIFPAHSETIVSAFNRKEVIARLNQVTQNVNFLDFDETKKKSHLFNGVVKEDSFRISLVIDKADSFLPLIAGKIESTAAGCILFLKYSLFPGASFFLGFWSVIILAMSLFFFLGKSDPAYGFLCLAIGLGNYLFAWIHFKRKIRKSQSLFYNLLNLQVRD